MEITRKGPADARDVLNIENEIRPQITSFTNIGQLISYDDLFNKKIIIIEPMNKTDYIMFNNLLGLVVRL